MIPEFWLMHQHFGSKDLHQALTMGHSWPVSNVTGSAYHCRIKAKRQSNNESKHRHAMRSEHQIFLVWTRAQDVCRWQAWICYCTWQLRLWKCYTVCFKYLNTLIWIHLQIWLCGAHTCCFKEPGHTNTQHRPSSSACAYSSALRGTLKLHNNSEYVWSCQSVCFQRNKTILYRNQKSVWIPQLIWTKSRLFLTSSIWLTYGDGTVSAVQHSMHARPSIALY